MMRVELCSGVTQESALRVEARENSELTLFLRQSKERSLNVELADRRSCIGEVRGHSCRTSEHSQGKPPNRNLRLESDRHLNSARSTLAPRQPHASTTMPQYLKHAAAYANLLSKYDTFLFDLDGVIWNGSLGNDL